MKLIKICLLIIAVLQANNAPASTPKPADTGAAKTGPWATAPRIQAVPTQPTVMSVHTKPPLVPSTPCSSPATIKPVVSTVPTKSTESSPISAASATPAPATTTSPKISIPLASLSLVTFSDKPVRPQAITDQAADTSELPTVYKGCHPDITTKRGKYTPSMIGSWQFPIALRALRTNEPVDSRVLEKASAEALQYSSKFESEDVAELAILINDKKIDINPAYWGNLHCACNDAKRAQALDIVNYLKEELRKLQLYKAGEVASLEGYGRSNGSGSSSPKAGYGIGAKFADNKTAALLQLTAKAIEIAAEETATPEAAAGGVTGK